uniref:Uncharacterized protein n=1 Tax=Hyaloperonospora arabidopsidis (strain Emoy2) TaxID=559515 RepID=M4C0Z4_HYAAE
MSLLNPILTTGCSDIQAREAVVGLYSQCDWWKYINRLSLVEKAPPLELLVIHLKGLLQSSSRTKPRLSCATDVDSMLKR